MGWAWKQDGRPLEQQLLHGGSPLEASLGSQAHWCHLAWGLWSQAVWREGDSTRLALSDLRTVSLPLFPQWQGMGNRDASLMWG